MGDGNGVVPPGGLLLPDCLAVGDTAVTQERGQGEEAPDAEGAIVHDLVTVHLQDPDDSPHFLVTEVQVMGDGLYERKDDLLTIQPVLRPGTLITTEVTLHCAVDFTCHCLLLPLTSSCPLRDP